ncbi:putative beta-lactamase HcpD precursor [Enhygromyxa salina]|uniref:Putative beta-lactamase HcpD n=1 Tax=Enhygromyxa salina TaxID=215803 RepID=A0A2S9Y1P2_9BACT|nr:putative beta-lactamase HcpD precursor [Enhygromyxa salina]
MLALLVVVGCRPKDGGCADPVACERACSPRSTEACFAAGRMYGAGIHGRRQPKRAVEMFEQACKAGHPGACTYLGSSYEHGVGVGADLARAQRYYESACNSGDGRACIGLGTLIEAENPSQARVLFERGLDRLEAGCVGEPETHCGALALLHVQGIGVEIGLDEGERLYAMACDAGDVESCSAVAELVRSRDRARSDQYYARACDGGYLYACVQHGIDLLLGTGPDADPGAGVARLREACEVGEPRACAALGTAYVSGVGVEVDAQAGVALYERGCRDGDGYACGSLGLLYSLGTGVPRDLDRAGGLFAHACEAGDALACGNLGWMHLRGIGFPEDRDGGVKLLDDACEAGDGRSCYRLGLHLAEQGPDHEAGTTAEGEAARLWRRGCELGSPDACTALSVSFIDGESGGEFGGDPGAGDQRLAVDLARYGCQEGSAAGCTLAGQIFALGWNVEQDRTTAEAYFRYACDLGDVDGCEVLASWLGAGADANPDANPDEDRAADEAAAAELWVRGRSLRERSCSEGELEDCIVLGAYYVRGLGVDKDFGRAVELYGQACEGGVTLACTQRAQILITGSLRGPESGDDQDRLEANYAEAFELLSQGCAAGDPLACVWLGLAYHRGRGVEADGEKAAEYYGRGCEQRFAFGCIGMGKLHEQGFGVAKNRRAARRFFAQACDLGANKFCR